MDQIIFFKHVNLQGHEDCLSVGAEGEGLRVAVSSVGCHGDQLKQDSGEAQALGAAGTNDLEDLDEKINNIFKEAI